MQQDYKCGYCGKSFHRESTLSAHMCVKKRRHIDRDTAGSRFGLRAFQRFHELATQSKKIKTFEDFVNSPYYIDFVKFGNYLAMLRPVHPEQFIDFLIRHSVKLKDWTREDVYGLYINDLVRREPATSAVARSIEIMVEWSEENNSQFTEFFSLVSPNEAARMIQTGKISPWVLYLSQTGEYLMNRLNEDHAKMVGVIIDPAFWKKKFTRQDDDVDYIRNILEQAQL